MMKYLLIAILVFHSITISCAQDKRSMFRDTTDNAFDVSQFLDEVYGFVAVPTIITEPAIGFGGGLGLVFIKKKYDEDGNPLRTPPDLFGVGGMGTVNGSWAVGGVYMGFWNEDRIRYRGATGYGSFNLDYYRTGPLGNERKYSFNIKGFLIMQEVSFRLGKAPLFAGLQYTFAKSSAEFDFEPVSDIPGVDPIYLEVRTGGLGPVITLDTRDNIFTPDKGIKALFSWQYFDEVFGSEPKFNRFQVYGLGYWKFNSRFFGGVRLESRFASSDAPFYSLPYVELRGVAAMRYQGNSVFILETEERWNFSPRWAGVGFAGWGKGILDGQDFSDAENAWNAGGGIRYLIARNYGIYGGADIARGPEEWAFYFVFGSSWGRL